MHLTCRPVKKKFLNTIFKRDCCKTACLLQELGAKKDVEV